MTWLVHSYSFWIDGARECKSIERAKRVQKPDNGHVDLDSTGLAALLADLVDEGMGKIMGHAPVKGHSDLTSSRLGTSMPMSDGWAIRVGDDRGGVDCALAGARAWLAT